jgi:putative iron-dependent peroxidase
MTLPFQPGIAADVPSAGRYLFFSLSAGVATEALRAALARLAERVDGVSAVAGLGPQLVEALGRHLPGQREFPSFDGAAVSVPRTPTALWLWLRSTDATDRGDLVLSAQAFEAALAPALHLDRVIDGFRHGRGPNGHGRDLTGYEDGTENPSGDAALAAAFADDLGDGLDGSSFVAVQQWVHDFPAFQALPAERQDHVMGRRRVDNEELEDAPESAHVKRTAQEDFDPEAFVLRRSMPWALGSKAGLMFVAFGRTHDAYEAQMRRMAGLDDGITDALFTISHPVSGAYFWCPPLRDGRLDLRRLGL